MTAEQFNEIWSSNYPGTVPIQHYFRHEYPHRWFRIHSLPGSKRYAETEYEWKILLDRQNEIITDLLGDNSCFILVTGEYSQEGYIELHPLEDAKSIARISFVLLEPIDLHKLSPEEYEVGQYYKPMFSEQTWKAGKFDKLLRDMAYDNLRAFFISVDKKIIVAPYDGGIDLILKNSPTRDSYRLKYKEWLSAREDRC